MVVGHFFIFLMGLILGMMGAGGSILTIPIFVYLFNMEPFIAATHSLFVVAVTALFGSFSYIRKKEISVVKGITFIIPSFLGVVFAKKFILNIIPMTIYRSSHIQITKNFIIMTVFSILMMAASWTILKNKIYEAHFNNKKSHRLVMALLGFVVGVVIGFVGIGGGFIMIPVFVILMGLKMREAIGTSLVIISINALFGFLLSLNEFSVLINWQFLSIASLIAILGALMGSRYSHLINEKKLKFFFGWAILYLSLFIIGEQIFHFLIFNP